MGQQENGNSSKGKLYKGSAPMKHVQGYKPVSSIPAKFETVLFNGPREKKGFNSDSKRFGDLDNEMPGPGSYIPGKSADLQSDSLSKKGYGPMASNSKRFQNKYFYTGPGPGEYDDLTISGSQNKPPLMSAVFYSHSNFSRKRVETPPSAALGPPPTVTRHGARLEYGADKPGATSTFKSKSNHETVPMPPSLDVPPATHYDMGDPWDASRHRRGVGGASVGGTSSFASSRTTTTMTQVMMDLNSLLFGPEKAAVDADKLENTPGPGFYCVDDVDTIHNRIERGRARPSPVFNVPEFSANPKPSPPSEMQSELQPNGFVPGLRTISGEKANAGASSVFKSRSPGHADQIDRIARNCSVNAPGPAYYQPLKEIRKSFHINSKKKYVTIAK